MKRTIDPELSTGDYLKKWGRDIQIHAIMLYKNPGFFADESRRGRWRSCLEMVAHTYISIGPQSFRCVQAPSVIRLGMEALQ